MIIRYLAPALLLTGCGPRFSEEPVKRIELRQSGWESLDVSVASNGFGSFERSGPAPEPITGNFRITPQDFSVLEARLDEFRKSAVTRTNASIQEIGNRRCPSGVPYVTDLGAIYVRWIGEGFDQHYVADLGCDRERHAERNVKLNEIVSSLPVSRPRS